MHTCHECQSHFRASAASESTVKLPPVKKPVRQRASESRSVQSLGHARMRRRHSFGKCHGLASQEVEHWRHGVAWRGMALHVSADDVHAATAPACRESSTSGSAQRNVKNPPPTTPADSRRAPSRPVVGSSMRTQSKGFCSVFHRTRRERPILEFVSAIPQQGVCTAFTSISGRISRENTRDCLLQNAAHMHLMPASTNEVRGTEQRSACTVSFRCVDFDFSVAAPVRA
jgi:hypothetical protein